MVDTVQLNDRYFLDDREMLSEIITDTPTGQPFTYSVLDRDDALAYVAVCEQQRREGRRPFDWMTYGQLGTAQNILGDSEGGLQNLRKALEMHRCSITLVNVSIALDALGRFDESFKLSEEAFQLDPGNQMAGLQYSQNLFRRGDLDAGFNVTQQICWDNFWYRPLLEHVRPWTGQDLAGKRLMVVKNGGYGDNFLFMRQLPLLKERGAHITYVCPAEMAQLAVQQDDLLHCVLPTEGKPTDHPEFDFHASDFDYFVAMMGITPQLGPAWPALRYPGPYVRATEVRNKRVRKPLVGFCWKAGELMDPRKFRSLSDAERDEILGFTGVEWLSLQYGAPCPQGCWEPLPFIRDWLDTANVMAGLDLVVTIDTGVAHLAGAMGLPVWVMLPRLSAWMYQLRGDTMPFYPTMRVFRADERGLVGSARDLIKALGERYG